MSSVDIIRYKTLEIFVSLPFFLRQNSKTKYIWIIKNIFPVKYYVQQCSNHISILLYYKKDISFNIPLHPPRVTINDRIIPTRLLVIFNTFTAKFIMASVHCIVPLNVLLHSQYKSKIMKYKAAVNLLITW